MKQQRYTRILFWTLVLILSLPLINLHWPVVESGKLYGAVTSTPDTAWNWCGWWSGAIQKKKEAFLNDSIGYRPDLVRLHNQLDFSLFKKLHVNGTVLGRNGYLYERGYIDVYCGTGYGGPAYARELMRRLKTIQDSFTARGKSLIFLLAPSKARSFPEMLPQDMACNGTAASLYPDVKRIADSMGIHTLDANAWFLSLKGKTPYPLLTKGGIHWSTYGSLRVVDTLLRYFTSHTSVQVPQLVFRALNPTRERNESDQDIEYALNLIAPLASEEISRPDYEFFPLDTAAGKKPKFIFLGDSFLWSFIYRGVPGSISDGWEFWYYFREIWNADATSGKQSAKDIADFDWRASLNNCDALVMVFTEINLGPGSALDRFVDEAYRYYVQEGGESAVSR